MRGKRKKKRSATTQTVVPSTSATGQPSPSSMTTSPEPPPPTGIAASAGVLRDPPIAHLRRKILALEFLACAGYLYMYKVYLKPLGPISKGFSTLRLYSLIQSILFFGVCGIGVVDAIRRLPRASLLRLARLRILLLAALIAMSVVLVLSLLDTTGRIAIFLVDHLPQLRNIGATVLEKVIDWTAGGIVFELVRRVYSRLVRKAAAHDATPPTAP